jgi:acyl carrier protein
MLTEQDVIDLINELDINVDIDAISAKSTLKSLGIDSLDVFTLLVEIETKTGKKIPDEDVDKLDTINAIVGYFS